MGKKWGAYSRLRDELYCEHGVGHGYHVHGCCGSSCCSHSSFKKAYEKAVADLGADRVKTESYPIWVQSYPMREGKARVVQCPRKDAKQSKIQLKVCKKGR
jgi:hypothetical protein